MADYKVTDTELTSIANAIRTKGGTQAQLEFPTGFVSAVNAIPTGGGGDDDWKSLVNYIESSGTQWIDTGYIPKTNNRFEVIANLSSYGGTYATIFGARDGSSGGASDKACWSGYKRGGTVGMLYSWGTADNIYSFTPSQSPYIGNKCKYVATNEGFAVYSIARELPIGTGISAGDITNTQPLYLFTLNQNGSDFGTITKGFFKLYRFRIYEGSNLVHEFIPWQDNGVACLKDIVTGNLKYNAGTGDFVYGTDT